jgi:transketolase
VDVAGQIRLTVVEQSKRANVGHIGSALSVADILGVLYGSVLRLDGSDRDRFILSKGHAALALYAALNATGRLDDAELGSFCTDGTPLGAHPEHALDAVDFSTGSLGHGLAIGCGAALAARMEGSDRRVFVLLSDAECNEGSVWESAMFAAHHRLGNLTAVVDDNGQQALGYTREIMDLSPLAERWGAFGWETVEVDGHDRDALETALGEPHPGGPRLVVAKTTFGRGVSFMERQIEWHYWPLSDEQYRDALRDLEAAAD